ncbi:Kiwa anti-phage protein KwaB-like domain-containing protein [Oceanobacillus caeni]|uniref:DUF4868 domain-containing protein n=1 Tax=Oceanobacillus caeni TaxID=405946 RepID=A0ABR5MFH8_9BACI|nr:Kiwa anti-phage protein KwaB-like domain-containing protein [Oceanobacillus caeni]KPH70902.1 hypothetical protein AFL42_16510 [Oceanobacillus caeni]
MSYDLLIEGLEMVKTVKSWSLDVINYNHKSRPYEYTCYSLNFQSDEVLKNTINDMCSKFNSIIDRYGRKVQEYTGANSKNVVDKISVSNKLISKPWDSLIQSLSVSDDYTKLKEIKSKAFIFVGTYIDDGNDQNIYLLSRKNPIYTYKKDRAKIFESRHNKIKEISEPLIQFGKTFDALIYKDTLYTINNNFESIFHMEYSHKVVCKNSLQTIREANVIKDFQSYNSFALSGQHPKKFITFDPRIIDNIQQESNLKVLVDELKIPYDYTSKKFDLIDEKQADVFTKAICGKTKYNMFTDGVCEVPNSIPLNLS